METVEREPDEVLGVVEIRKRPVTVEKVAINAVMAGCLPEYFPVVLAIVEALLDKPQGPGQLQLIDVSTGGTALGFIVNGPIRTRLKMNYRGNVLGPGNRANSTIGRAIRLNIINVFGSVPGAGNTDEAGRDILDRSTIGQPGKYACYHIVENEEDFPALNPLHVELGFSHDQSVVTVFPVSGHVQVSVHAEGSAEEIVDTIVHYMVHSGKMSQGLTGHGVGSWAVVIPPEKAETFVRDGWSKAAIRASLFERTTRSVAWLKQNWWLSGDFIGRRGEPVMPGDEALTVAITRRPEDIFIAVAGGPAGGWVHFLMPYTGPARSRVIRV